MALGLWIFVLLTAFSINEASNEAFDDVAISEMHVASKAEVMARMTTETALDTFSRMRSPKKTLDLMATIQQKFGLTSSRNQKRQFAQMQTTLRGAVKTTPTTGYSALYGATNMLNEMIWETGSNLELETKRCQDEATEAHGTMGTLRQQVASFNSEAAGARGRVVSAQGEIATLETNIDRDETTLEGLKALCKTDIGQMKYELKIITADVDVMNNILDMIGDCPAEVSGPPPGGQNVLKLLQCSGCDVLLQHAGVQKMLGGLQSSSAREAVKSTLSEAWEEKTPLTEAWQEPEEHDEEPPPEEAAQPEDEPVVLTQEEAEHMLSTLGQRTANMSNVTLNISEMPEPPEPQGCVETNKCVLGPANCPKLRDRFIGVQSGIVDQQADLAEHLRVKENYCQEQTKLLGELILGMEETLRVERVNLATGTEDQNTAEAGSHTNAQQHEAAVTERIKGTKTCCDNRNTMISELCALDRIRGELNNVNGTQTFISDCEVSEWQTGECSVTCGSGTRKDTRSVIAHTAGNGVSCPPLTAASSCNTQKCAVDCVVDEWSGWSECSAECGGGVKERSRHELLKAAYGGEVCPSLEEEISCGAGACNVNCQLTKWTDWTEQCSKVCGSGKVNRVRNVEVEAKGTGRCAKPTQINVRLQFRGCNGIACTRYLKNLNAPDGKRKILKCDSQIDLTIVMSGASSLGKKGWEQSKKLVEGVIRNLTPRVSVSVLLYSGPVKWKGGVQKCLENSPNISIEKDCKVKWVSHLTQDFDSLAKTVGNLTWPKGGSLTSLALGMVDADLMYGRVGAESKVLVISDNKPLSNANTKAAAARLQQKATIEWVSITARPLTIMRQMSLAPWSDHVVYIPNSNNLKVRFNFWLNKVITTTCPQIA